MNWRNWVRVLKNKDVELEKIKDAVKSSGVKLQDENGNVKPVDEVFDGFATKWTNINFITPNSGENVRLRKVMNRTKKKRVKKKLQKRINSLSIHNTYIFSYDLAKE